MSDYDQEMLELFYNNILSGKVRLEHLQDNQFGSSTRDVCIHSADGIDDTIYIFDKCEAKAINKLTLERLNNLITNENIPVIGRLIDFLAGKKIKYLAINYKGKHVDIDTFFNTFRDVLSKVTDEVYIRNLNFSQSHLKLIIEACSGVKTIVLSNCNIGSISDNFNIRNDLDYKIKTINLENFSDNRSKDKDLKTTNFTIFIEAIQTTNMKDNLKFFGIKDSFLNVKSVEKIMEAFASVSVKDLAVIKKVSNAFD